MVVRAIYSGHGRGAGQLLGEALTRARTVQDEAGQAVRRARAGAGRKIRSVKARARCLGYKHGLRSARRHELSRMLELQTLQHQMLATANRECFELALTAAREIVGSSLKSSRTLALKIRTALDALMYDHRLRIAVHPRQKAAVEQSLRTSVPPMLPFEIEGDEQVALGNALLTTAAGTIELNWEEQFELIKRTLSGRLDALLAPRSITDVATSSSEGER